MDKHVFHKVMIAMLLVMGVVLFSACRGEDEVITHTVTFETFDGSAIDPQTVQNGRRVDRPTNPTRDDGAEFIGWFKDSDYASAWNFEVDIVTEPITLYAQWRRIEPFPTEIAMTDTPFSNTVTWIQSGVTANTNFEITLTAGVPQVDVFGRTLYSYPDEGEVVNGTHEVIDDLTVRWSPDNPLQGGVYKITIMTEGDDPVEAVDLAFRGVGTEENPFLVFSPTDLAGMVESDQVGLGQYYRLMQDITREVAYANIQNNAFHGTFDGQNYTISLTGNAGLFFELGETAIIENLIVDGNVQTNTTPLLGSIAHENRGLIRDTVSWITITSSAGQVGNPDTKFEGGVGGLVGINHENGRIENCRFRSSGSSVGVLKANIGAGGIASINYGTISRCENRGALGAFNAVESGRSLQRYSYMGGIAGFNYGVIEQSNTTSVGKLLAQRYWNVTPPDGTENNRVIGGIAGYNAAEGIIRESFFNGIRVHGDQYVGGIAGINAGLITHSYVSARYYGALSGRSYVGGRSDVGGIAGILQGEGRVEYSFAAINVFAYESTPYAIASEAFNSVYIRINHDLRATGTHDYGNVPTDLLGAPAGSGNTLVDNSPLGVGDGIDYELPGSFAALLGAPFTEGDTGTILSWEQE